MNGSLVSFLGQEIGTRNRVDSFVPRLSQLLIHGITLFPPLVYGILHTLVLKTVFSVLIRVNSLLFSITYS